MEAEGTAPVREVRGATDIPETSRKFGRRD